MTHGAYARHGNKLSLNCHLSGEVRLILECRACEIPFSLPATTVPVFEFLLAVHFLLLASKCVIEALIQLTTDSF